jgi:hypothetical protein
MDRIALDKAENATNIRLANMNEFRAALTDASKSYINREYYESRHQMLQNQIDDLRIFKGELMGKASQNSVIFAYILGLVGIVLSIIDFFTKMTK